MVIILVVIGDYFICAYWCLLVLIDGYYISGYWWLLMVITLVAIGDY
jgi:hypothetical protein